MYEHYHFPEIGSTNDYIKELLEEHEQVIVTADLQHKGRGRRAKKWHGMPGENVFFSFGINHKSTPSSTALSLYQATGCLAAHDVLKEICGKDIFRIKYPNDIMAKTEEGYRKICGVLVEHTFSGSACQSSIIGIGINVNQIEFPDSVDDMATSLKLLKYDATPSEVIEKLIDVTGKYVYRPSEEIFEDWEKRLNVVGKPIELLGQGGNWAATFLYNDGRLKLENIDTNESFILGDGDSIRYDYND